MLRPRLLMSLSLIVPSLLFTGCTEKIEPTELLDQSTDYSKPLPPGMMALRKIGPEDYPDFSRGFNNRLGLEQAIRNSLDYLSKPSSERYFPYLDVSHDRAIASLEHLLTVLRSAQSPEALDAAIRQDFEVYESVGYDGDGTVYFTGYYCPIFEGRRQPDGQFRYPLYSLPEDLVKDPEGITQGRRMPNGSIVPYPTRKEIETSGMMRGKEIAWLKDPFEAYVVTVQGSAKLRQADGSLLELGYAGNNGYEYTSVGRQLVKEGKIPADELSLQSMIAYFKQHPAQVRPYCWQNERYVFFQESQGGPFGSLNVPVLPFRSIATDKEVFPRACPAFLDTRLPIRYQGDVRIVPYAGFAMDQDTGGAIRAAGRCDVFMGIGDEAEALAGRTGSEGALYYIFVKPGVGGGMGQVPTGRTSAPY